MWNAISQWKSLLYSLSPEIANLAGLDYRGALGFGMWDALRLRSIAVSSQWFCGGGQPFAHCDRGPDPNGGVQKVSHASSNAA